jgi:hypothetical protein
VGRHLAALFGPELLAALERRGVLPPPAQCPRATAPPATAE